MEIKCKIDNLKNHQVFLEVKKMAGAFLQKKGFKEIETPLLSPKLIPESYLEVFETKNLFDKENQEMYLIPSPELFLKRLIVEGVGNCYFLGKSFRNNEPVEKKHSYEFTILEFYRVDGDYFDIIEDVMEMLRFMVRKMWGGNELEYQGKKIKLDVYEKITVAEAFKKYAGITDIFNHKNFFKQAKEKGYRVAKMDYTDVWSQIYGIEVEPNLGKNGLVTFICEYPRELAATAQFNKEKNISERLEFYMEGIELGNCGNASTEKTNIKEYKKRFKEDIQIREKTKVVRIEPDYDFIDVLQKLPKCAGIAIGVDRLAMILADLKSIQDLRVIFFE